MRSGSSGSSTKTTSNSSNSFSSSSRSKRTMAATADTGGGVVQLLDLSDDVLSYCLTLVVVLFTTFKSDRSPTTITTSSAAAVAAAVDGECELSLRLVCKRFSRLPYFRRACLLQWPNLFQQSSSYPSPSASALPSMSSGISSSSSGFLPFVSTVVASPSPTASAFAGGVKVWAWVWVTLKSTEVRWKEIQQQEILDSRTCTFEEIWAERQCVRLALAQANHQALQLPCLIEVLPEIVFTTPPTNSCSETFVLWVARRLLLYLDLFSLSNPYCHTQQQRQQRKRDEITAEKEQSNKCCNLSSLALSGGGLATTTTTELCLSWIGQAAELCPKFQRVFQTLTKESL